MDKKINDFRDRISADDFVKIKNNKTFQQLSEILGFTEEDMKEFEKKYYPELSEEKEVENKEDKHEIISMEMIEHLKKGYKQYNKTLSDLGGFVKNCFDNRLPIVHLDTLFFDTIHCWLGEEKADALFDYMEGESDYSLYEIYDILNA